MLSNKQEWIFMSKLYRVKQIDINNKITHAADDNEERHARLCDNKKK